jgi:hypothetical protein
MKKRVIFCLFLSIYLIYTHKEFFLIKIEELPYISFLIRVVVDIFANISDHFSWTNSQVTAGEFRNFEIECKKKF